MTDVDERREALVQRFRDLLGQVLDREAAPSGIPPEVWADLERGTAAESTGGDAGDRETDLFAIWSALTALTQEIKLQGRAFKQLHDRLETTAGLDQRIDEVLAGHREALDETRRIAEEGRAERRQREGELRRDVEAGVRREMIALLLPLRDRLARGLDAARSLPSTGARRTGWLAALFGGARERGQDRVEAGRAALEEGYRLTLESLEENLAAHRVREIECLGRAFDPHLMEAVDREETTRAEPGTVLEVYQRGYLWSGELFRPARVKVAAAPHP